MCDNGEDNSKGAKYSAFYANEKHRNLFLSPDLYFHAGMQYVIAKGDEQPILILFGLEMFCFNIRTSGRHPTCSCIHPLFEVGDLGNVSISLMSSHQLRSPVIGIHIASSILYLSNCTSSKLCVSHVLITAINSCQKFPTVSIKIDREVLSCLKE